MPCRGPRSLPAAISLSACLACSSARSAVTVAKAPSFGSSASMRARQARVSSTGDTWRERSSFDRSLTGLYRTSSASMGPLRPEGAERAAPPHLIAQLEVADLLERLLRPPHVLSHPFAFLGGQVLLLLRPKAPQ